MKFAKLFQIYKDADHVTENYISIEEVFQLLQKNDGKANKYNIKRSLQTFQGGQKTICGKESATVGAVLKYCFSYSNSSKACATVVKNIERELLSGEKNYIEKSSLDLYKQIAKANIHQYTGVFEQIDIPEQEIVTLVVEHKSYFNSSEWKRICWFENSFSRDLKLQQSELSYEDVLELKYCKYQSLLTLIDCSKTWVCESEAHIQQKNLRYQASDKESQVGITSGHGHIAIIIDSDVKSLIDIYCPDSIGHTVCFDLTNAENANSVWVVLFQNHELQVSFDDLCSKIFYTLKRRHNICLESVLLIKTEELKDYVSEDGNVYRFLLRDAVETKQLKKISKVWQAALIDGTIDSEEDIQCQTCFKGVLSKPLSTDNFNIVQEWYLEIPIETQVLLENFINKETIRRHKDPEHFIKKKLQKLYSFYDVLLNLHNKKFTGLFQKSNSSKLLIEYKSVGSVFDITSAAGTTSSLSRAETQVKSNTCKDLCYYNTYLIVWHTKQLLVNLSHVSA